MSEDSEKILSDSLHAMARDIKDRDAEIERLRADRDSWADQADARVKDCVEYISEIERLRKDFMDLLRVAANDATAFQAEIERLRALVVRAADFCDYAGFDGDVLEYGIRCCCGTRDFEAHRKGCEYGEEATRKV
jgi:hypothetical protein